MKEKNKEKSSHHHTIYVAIDANYDVMMMALQFDLQVKSLCEKSTIDWYLRNGFYCLPMMIVDDAIKYMLIYFETTIKI